MTVPELTTERLRLRAFHDADFPAYAEMMADPEVTRFLGHGQPLDAGEAWRQMAMFAGHWVLRGFGIWAAEERATGRFVGRVGCFQPHDWPGFEIGYTFARAAWGRGLASEGARAALDHAHRVLGRTHVISVIHPGNVRSQRVALGLGARLEREVPFFGGVARCYAYPPPPGAPA
jgi:RimJ/RimL family protein N-acetyltransferase